MSDINSTHVKSDLEEFAKLSARINCPGTCANDLNLYSSVQEAMLGAVVAIEEYYPEKHVLNPLQMHLVLGYHRALVFPTCNAAMSEGQYRVLSGQ